PDVAAAELFQQQLHLVAVARGGLAIDGQRRACRGHGQARSQKGDRVSQPRPPLQSPGRRWPPRIQWRACCTSRRTSSAPPASNRLTANAPNPASNTRKREAPLAAATLAVHDTTVQTTAIANNSAVTAMPGHAAGI